MKFIIGEGVRWSEQTPLGVDFPNAFSVLERFGRVISTDATTTAVAVLSGTLFVPTNDLRGVKDNGRGEQE